MDYNNTNISKIINPSIPQVNNFQDEDQIYDLYNNKTQLLQKNISPYGQTQIEEQEQNFENLNDYLEISFENYKSFSEFQNEEEEEEVKELENQEQEQFSICSDEDLFEISINTHKIDDNTQHQLDYYFIYRQRTVLIQKKYEQNIQQQQQQQQQENAIVNYFQIQLQQFINEGLEENSTSNQQSKKINLIQDKQLTTFNQINKYTKSSERQFQYQPQKKVNMSLQNAGHRSKKFAKKINTLNKLQHKKIKPQFKIVNTKTQQTIKQTENISYPNQNDQFQQTNNNNNIRQQESNNSLDLS
ncbi:hypothetical protein TTHERM_00641370 (macronuclear) [Tetrahymena thermophila SB210]|uniref:Uncharacterized protein n=1 Tax=Tetrahymena thermophila (strain SB210) TaxID=312017 RepID=Q23EZ6_TETTS|nr:hypothetical protein TTHERM_00641370 [Tetrahymena thermophila SB210]EAR95109.1 hypothetical protein TTHERM_00641370 [Tetrahymena thermophila SB210]|eukprot:XP_001015354.1 hypothetical protein TTHERM_00641370 [Tetrahymena thermophila SB210]